MPLAAKERVKADPIIYLYARLVSTAARAGGALEGDDPGPAGAPEGMDY